MHTYTCAFECTSLFKADLRDQIKLIHDKISRDNKI